MSFKSENELEQFSFENCEVVDVTQKEDKLEFKLEALIVRPRNSQNANYTESYADTATLSLFNPEIIEAFKEGYKLYDANDNVKEEIPDVELAAAEIQELLYKKAKGMYLADVVCGEKTPNSSQYTFFFEEPPTEEYGDDLRSDSYMVRISFEKSVICWERYLNRVER